MKNEMSQEKTPRKLQGRFHYSFLGFPKSYLKTIDMTKVKPV